MATQWRSKTAISRAIVALVQRDTLQARAIIQEDYDIDRLEVEVSTDGGTSWTEVHTTTGTSSFSGPRILQVIADPTTPGSSRKKLKNKVQPLLVVEDDDDEGDDLDDLPPLDGDDDNEESAMEQVD